MARRLTPLLLLAACGGAIGDPVFGMDALYVEPAGEGRVWGTQSWSLYDAAWVEHGAPARFVCTVLVVVEGVESEAACEKCDVAYDVVATRQEDDCARGVLAGFDVLDGMTGLGFGEAPERLGAPPVDGGAGLWLRYPGEGWFGHGWAYPEGTLRGTAWPDAWDASEPFQGWPGEAWSLTDGARVPIP